MTDQCPNGHFIFWPNLFDVVRLSAYGNLRGTTLAQRIRENGLVTLRLAPRCLALCVSVVINADPVRDRYMRFHSWDLRKGNRVSIHFADIFSRYAFINL